MLPGMEDLTTEEQNEAEYWKLLNVYVEEIRWSSFTGILYALYAMIAKNMLQRFQREEKRKESN